MRITLCLKNMNLIKMVLFCIIILTLGCTKSKVPDVIDDDRKTVQFRIQTGDTSGYLDATEYTINSVRLVVFDGDVLDNSVFVNNISNTTGIIEVELKLKAAENKRVFTIINEPARLTNQLDRMEFLVEFESIEYKLADYFNHTGDNPNNVDVADVMDAYSYQEGVGPTSVFYKNNLPMSGIDMIQTLTQQNFDLKVGRALARIDIWLSAAEAGVLMLPTSSISYNVSDGGRIINIAEIPSQDITTKILSAKKTSIPTDKYIAAFTFYTPERINIGRDRLEFIIKNVNYAGTTHDLIPFYLESKIDGIVYDKIERNKLYTIKLIIGESGEVTFNYSVEPWAPKEIIVPPFE